jgi:hypothetical protein
MSAVLVDGIGKMIVAELGDLVKKVEAIAKSGQVVDLSEIEEQVQQVMRRAGGRALTAMAEAVRAVVEEQVRCDCGRISRYKGEQGRQQETLVGRLQYRRGYYYCGECGQGRYPVDEAMEVSAGQFSRKLQEAMALAGTLEAFEPAAKRIKAMVGLVVSASAVQRVTEGCGATLECKYRLECEQALRDGEVVGAALGEGKSEGQQWVAELDAAKVPLRDDWHEAKVGVVCLGETHGHGQNQQRPPVKTLRPSYTTHVGGIEDAGVKLYAETLRRGVRPWQDTVVCLADGAPGNWNQFALHFPLRVEILDWYHAMEHLWAAGKAGLGEGSDEANAWVKEQETLLWQGQVQTVIEAVETLANLTASEPVAREARYLRTNEKRMDYAHFREQGYPIGSGAVESACKRLVGARLKGSGMRWTAAGSQAVLNLCAALASDRWDEEWPRTLPIRMAA